MPQFPSIIELSALDGSDGFRIEGAAPGHKSGYSVAAAGDVNGDSFDDVVIGAYRAGPHGDYSGSAYVVFGKANGRLSAISLASLSQANGFRIDGAAIDDQLGRSVAAAGDVNGDGFDDVMVGAPGTDSGGLYSNSGSAYVIYGRASGVAAPVDVATLNGKNGFRLDGGSSPEEFNHKAGWAIASAGDINRDGQVDLIVGAYRADINGRMSGSSYVVFGRQGGLAANTDLAKLNGTNGFRLDGPSNGYSAGYSVASAGDINGDGRDDLLIGAPRASKNGLYSGSSYVVFGKTAGFASALNLGTLDGRDGFRLDGPAGTIPLSGCSIASAGDVNGDGFDDMIIGAHLAGTGELKSAGASYVVFGHGGGFASAISLANLNGANGFRIDGASARDRSGVSVASAGDINGDGFDDVIVGAYNARPGGEDSGASYVVFGKAKGFSASISLSLLNGSNGFCINGAADYDLSGRSVSAAGDVNGDGFDDLIVGAFGAHPKGPYSGASYIIYGHRPAATVSRIGSAASQTLAGGDFDDKLSAMAGNDTLIGHSGADSINGGLGRDSMNGGAGADVMAGGTDRDRMKGGDGNDRLSGEDGNDRLGGGDGNDVLRGGSGVDRMSGDDGNDILFGGAGRDSMAGGAGADRFHFFSADWGGDTIVDFEDGLDLLRFKSTIAEDVADFTIAGNGTRHVILSIGSDTLDLRGDKPITLTDADFQFLV